jgi:hypothetical protein
MHDSWPVALLKFLVLKEDQSKGHTTKLRSVNPNVHRLLKRKGYTLQY